MERKIRWEQVSSPIEDGEDNNDSNIEEGENKMMVVPIDMSGIISNQMFSPFNDTNFYICYTNFPVEVYMPYVSAVEGVEFFKLLGKYRFSIGIGPLFNDEDVKAAVEDILIQKNNNILDKLSPIIEKIKVEVGNQDLWLVYIFPNGKYYINTFENLDNLKDINNIIMEAMALRDMSNGFVISSESIKKFSSVQS